MSKQDIMKRIARDSRFLDIVGEFIEESNDDSWKRKLREVLIEEYLIVNKRLLAFQDRFREIRLS